MAVYALIKDGIVYQTIMWDGPEASPLDLPEGTTYVEIPDENGVMPSAGWFYKDGEFSAPPLTDDEIEQQKQQKIANNQATKVSLINYATYQINPLQDAVDLDMATEKEESLLKKWKLYRVTVSRIDANTDEEISWPDQP